MQKYAIVTGLSGMDASHMIDFLLENTDMILVGVNRRQSNPNTVNYKHLIGNSRVIIESADVTDPVSINNLIKKYQPSYFFNFCAQSHVHESWGAAAMTFQTNAVGVLNCLEAIRLYCPSCRFYSAGTSEQFSEPCYLPMDEQHTQSAKSPYAASKIAAFHLVNCYRRSYNLYAIHGVLFNHESERRSKAFLPRKISSGVAQIWHETKEGKTPTVIQVGDIYSKRDWSYSPDFMEAIYMMMNQELYRQDLQPELYREGNYSKDAVLALREYVLASGETRSVKELIELAFSSAGFSLSWQGEGINEKGYIFGNVLAVEINEKFYRPADVIHLHGTPKKIMEDLGWKPKTSFKNLVWKMVQHDIKNHKE